MRNITFDELAEVDREKDLLSGCLNCMCVTKDMEELVRMYRGAIEDVNKIFDINYKRMTADSEDTSTPNLAEYANMKLEL